MSAAASRRRCPPCSVIIRRITKCLIAGAAICIVAYTVIAVKTELSRSSTKQLLTTTEPVHTNRPTLVDAIALRASKDRYIVLAMVDEAFTDMASNLYETSLKPHHITNYLFVGVGNSTCEVLRRRSLECFYYANDPSAGHSSDYGHSDFIRKMNIRTDMILEALNGNFTVLHTDLDVCFLHNPLDEIKVTHFSYVTFRRAMFSRQTCSQVFRFRVQVQVPGVNHVNISTQHTSFRSSIAFQCQNEDLPKKLTSCTRRLVMH